MFTVFVIELSISGLCSSSLIVKRKIRLILNDADQSWDIRRHKLVTVWAFPCVAV